MYLLFGIFIALHLLAGLTNLDEAERDSRKKWQWFLLGLLFGYLGVLAYRITKYVFGAQEKNHRAKRLKVRKLTDPQRRENILGTVMALPPFAGFICFVLFPTAVSLIMSLFELHSYDLSRAEFVGLQNFITLIWKEPSGSTYVPDMVNIAFINTVIYCLSVPLRIVISVFIANLMAKPIRRFVNSPVRIILFLPSLCSSVGVTLMWQWILQADYGIVNVFLSAIGLKKINFMGDPNWFWFSVILMVLWMRATNIINLQAALANVSTSLIEAAELDGASKRQVFWKITLPSITPTLFYIVTMDLIAALQESGIMQFVTTNGVGPEYKAVTLSYYIYRMAFTSMATDGMGLGCALALMLAIFIIIINKLNMRLADRWVSYDA